MLSIPNSHRLLIGAVAGALLLFAQSGYGQTDPAEELWTEAPAAEVLVTAEPEQPPAPLFGTEEANRLEEGLEQIADKLERFDQPIEDRLSRELIDAARTADRSRALRLIAEGADPNAQDGIGNTPLTVAVRHGDIDMVHLLLNYGARVDGRGMLGVTPLMLAAEKDDAELVSVFLQAGADVNAKSESGRTALLVAQRNNNTPMTALLKSSGAEEAPHPPRPERALTEKDLSRELSEMLSSGDLDAHLIDAALEGDASRARRLLDKGADANTTGSLGMTALMFAARGGHADTVTLLLMRGANLQAQSSLGHTALSIAAMEGQAAALQPLIVSGAKINKRGYASMTPLMQAAQGGHVEAIRALILWGADVNAGNDFEMTALMFAAQAGHLQAVETLLELGADAAFQEAIAGQTARALAERKNHPEVARILKRAEERFSTVVSPDTASSDEEILEFFGEAVTDEAAGEVTAAEPAPTGAAPAEEEAH